MNLNLLANDITKQTSQVVERRAQIKKIIEALLFSSNEPLSLQKIKEIINTEILLRQDELRHIVTELQESYRAEGKPYQIDEIGAGFLLRTSKEMHRFVSLLHKQKKKDKLGNAAMEVVAIIAYQSPITKAEIEQIRGVDCGAALQNLQERELIEVVGYKETLGRPRQFGVTKKFLTHFGLNNLEQLTTESMA